MKIVSKFKDYYDGVANSNVDKEIIYKRETSDVSKIIFEKDKTLCQSKGEHFRLAQPVNGFEDEYVQTIFLGFCGHIYKGLKVYPYNRYLRGENQTGESKFFWTAESFIEHAKKNYPSFDNKKRFSYYEKFSTQKVVEEYFNETNSPQLEKLFFEYNVPVFTYFYQEKYTGHQEIGLKLNPNLKDLEFFKAKDAFTAFQELYTFVSGYLNQDTNPMVQISNQDKIDKHGFDKWSFRKMKDNK